MPASPSPAAVSGRRPGRHLAAFGRFWWEFLVGDTPELFVGMLAVLGLASLLAGTGAAAWVVVPAGVVAVLTISVARGRTRA